jgi:hypothetical protein
LFLGLFVAAGILFNGARPVKTVALGNECRGWGGAVVWLVHDSPHLHQTLNRLGPPGSPARSEYLRETLNPCDDAARTNLVNSWQGPLLIAIVVAGIVVFVGRIRARHRNGQDRGQVP